jgi:hypothetical protein
MTRKKRYRLYIDESGDHTYKNIDHPSRRYLSLLGVWLEQDIDYINLDTAMKKFKDGIFGQKPDDPIIFHRDDIINKRGSFVILRDEEILSRFNGGLLDLVSISEFSVIIVVIDKKAQEKKYKLPYHPYHYCLGLMLERYVGWLKRRNVIGDVLAESRGGKEDTDLKAAYRQFYEKGFGYCKPIEFQTYITSKDIKLKKKTDNIPGLQLADILAHPAKQAYLYEKGLVPEFDDNFGKRLVELIDRNFCCEERTGRVEGYGKKLFR